MRVLGLFGVTNLAGEPATHDDVLAMADEAAGAMSRLLAELLPRLGEGD
jgi:purine nucleoside phosphorylase